MKSVGEIVKECYPPLKIDQHIEARDGDFVGADGLLHCGVCGEGKEYYAKVLGRTVPCNCRCIRLEMAAEEKRRLEEQEMQRVRELAQYSIRGEKVQGARFENAETRPDMEKPMQIAKRYVQQWDAIYGGKTDMNGLLLYGPPGTGKSYLAACIANALMERRVTVLYTSVSRLVDAHPEDQPAILRGMRSTRLLVLDDLGTERGTDYVLERVYNIINERCNSKKPMVVTTNLDMAQMKYCTDVRYNRIFERVRAMCYPVRMDGESWRKRKAIEAMAEMKRILGG